MLLIFLLPQTLGTWTSLCRGLRQHTFTVALSHLSWLWGLLVLALHWPILWAEHSSPSLTSDVGKAGKPVLCLLQFSGRNQTPVSEIPQSLGCAWRYPSGPMEAMGKETAHPIPPRGWWWVPLCTRQQFRQDLSHKFSLDLLHAQWGKIFNIIFSV